MSLGQLGNLASVKTEEVVASYRALHAGSVDQRKAEYATLVNQYYDLATDFYEYGWGESFHFAPRGAGESHRDSLLRHERFLARRLGLRPGLQVIDLGCGVGGPAREIARWSGAQVLGINNNAYQVSRAEGHTRKAGLSRQVTFLKADFMRLPLGDASVDAAYAIEATCHAPDKEALFREVWRVLKPGAGFAGYEWCLTDLYRADDPHHGWLKKAIEEGDGLPDLATTHQVDEALVAAGFELVEARDLAGEGHPKTPWYLRLDGGELSVAGIQRTRLGRRVNGWLTRTLERVRIAPPGTSEVSAILQAAADGLVAGGKTGAFTPMYFFHVVKR
jgi:sterol 24-C-methyltransferase